MVQAGRKRGGGSEVGSRDCTAAGDNWSLSTRLEGGERAQERLPREGVGAGGRLPWATMYMERKDVSNLGDPLCVWERGCVIGAIPRGPGAGTGQEPRKQCGTTILLGPGL